MKSRTSLAAAAAGFLLSADVLTADVFATDWTRDHRIPVTGRANPLEIPAAEFPSAVRKGKLHTLHYPVDVTGILPPARPIESLLNHQLGGIFGPGGMLAWLGLHEYPADSGDENPLSPYAVPFPSRSRPEHRMGVTLMHREAEGLTFSCVACHSGNLFGRPVIGMTNRFPRANYFFELGKKSTQIVDPGMFRVVTGATAAEAVMYERMREVVKFIGTKKPQARGLDTALAHTSLSLSLRGEDPYATRNPENARHPRPDPLTTEVADSKPAPWWNLKYKTRYLLDGSIISGNPVYMAMIINEIGRGSDLREVEDWLVRNESTMNELTAAVFASEAPRFTDFFPASTLPIDRAKRGEAIFNTTCARCHGVYEKAWNLPHSAQLSAVEQLETVRVRYHEKSPIIDVGTDPGRYLGSRTLSPSLNRLAVFQRFGIQSEAQRGYIPPPLVGIWARWPYFHNNSAPSLCAVLTPGPQRPRTYRSGPAEDPQRDFDRLCNGYPTGSAVPMAWRQDEESFFNTTRRGMSNRGHDEGIFVRNGQEVLTPQNKADLIVFLQSL